MKKILVLLLMICLIGLVGCNKNNGDVEEIVSFKKENVVKENLEIIEFSITCKDNTSDVPSTTEYKIAKNTNARYYKDTDNELLYVVSNNKYYSIENNQRKYLSAYSDDTFNKYVNDLYKNTVLLHYSLNRTSFKKGEAITLLDRACTVYNNVASDSNIVIGKYVIDDLTGLCLKYTSGNSFDKDDAAKSFVITDLKLENVVLTKYSNLPSDEIVFHNTWPTNYVLIQYGLESFNQPEGTFVDTYYTNKDSLTIVLKDVTNSDYQEMTTDLFSLGYNLSMWNNIFVYTSFEELNSDLTTFEAVKEVTLNNYYYIHVMYSEETITIISNKETNETLEYVTEWPFASLPVYNANKYYITNINEEQVVYIEGSGSEYDSYIYELEYNGFILNEDVWTLNDVSCTIEIIEDKVIEIVIK